MPITPTRTSPKRTLESILSRIEPDKYSRSILLDKILSPDMKSKIVQPLISNKSKPRRRIVTFTSSDEEEERPSKTSERALKTVQTSFKIVQTSSKTVQTSSKTEKETPLTRDHPALSPLVADQSKQLKNPHIPGKVKLLKEGSVFNQEKRTSKDKGHGLRTDDKSEFQPLFSSLI